MFLFYHMTSSLDSFNFRTVLDGGTSKSKTFNFGSKSTQKFLSRTNALWVKMIAPTRINLSYNTYSEYCFPAGAVV